MKTMIFPHPHIWVGYEIISLFPSVLRSRVIFYSFGEIKSTAVKELGNNKNREFIKILDQKNVLTQFPLMNIENLKKT